jgi:hypothetical protein
MSSHATIREGYDVFVHDGDVKVGAVRRIERSHIVVFVENAGDFLVPFPAVREVEDGKVVLDCGKLDMTLRRAIGHAHDAEDPAARSGFPSGQSAD